jgi:hypothetical protein
MQYEMTLESVVYVCTHSAGVCFDLFTCLEWTKYIGAFVGF